MTTATQSTTTDSAAKPSPTSFEAGLDELNALVARMESGEAPLADMLTSYQRGTELLRFCEAQLKAAEQQLKVLDANGELKAISLD